MITSIKCEINKLLYRKEFWFMILFGILVGGAAYCELLPQYMYNDVNITLSATRAFMLWPNSGIGQMFILCLIPLFAAITYSDCYFKELNNGSIIPQIIRQNRKHYFLSKLLIVGLSSFLIVIIPLVFNQLLCLIAYPIKPAQSYYTGSIYEVNIGMDLPNVLFPILYMNNPLISNVIQIIMAGMLGAGLGMLSYVVSLFYRKNLLTTIGLTTLVYLMYFFLCSVCDIRQLAPGAYLYAHPSIPRTIENFAIILLVLYIIDFVLLGIKISGNKDVLV